MTLEKSKNAVSLQLAFESIDSCFGYVDYINNKISQLIALYNGNEHERANEAFIEVVELLDLYIQLVTKVYRVLRIELKQHGFKDESLQNLEIHLLSIVRALLTAKEKEDIIMLCDLLEYELMDNLTQWKIKVLPELKKLKNY